MLDTIPVVQDSSNGDPILGTLAAFPLNINLNSKSGDVQNALEDDIPVAVLSHDALISVLERDRAGKILITELQDELKENLEAKQGSGSETGK
jgi:hypothetical protein